MKMKLIAIIIIVTALASAFIMTSDDTEAAKSGICGDSLQWSLSNDTLTISGTGTMYDFDSGKAPWYSSRETIETVSIGPSVTRIGNHAFYNCSSIKNIDFGNVSSIGFKSFANCTTLQQMELTNVTEIDGFAFFGCSGLSLASFSKNLSSVGTSAFTKIKFFDEKGDTITSASGLAGKTFTGANSTLRIQGINIGTVFTSGSLIYKITSLNPAEASVTGSASGTESVNVPSTTTYSEKTFKITSVADQAFYNNTTITSASLGSVTAIGFKSFANCISLKTIDTGSAKSIGKYAFFGCTDVSSMKFSSDLESVGAFAFTKIKFYNGTTEMSATASNLAGKTFIGSASNLYLQKIPYVGYEFTTNGIMYKVTSMSPLEVAVTGAEAGIRSVSLPSAVTVEGSRLAVTSVADQAFYNNSMITSAKLGKATSIGFKSFANCISLGKIDLSSIKTIKNYAFFGCTGVSSMKFSSDLVSVEKSSFTKIKFYNGTTELSATASNLAGKTFVGSGSILHLQWDAPIPYLGYEFTSNGIMYKVTSMSPLEVAVTGAEAGIRSVSLPSAVTVEGSRLAVTSVADQAFYNNKTITSAYLGNVTSVGFKSFANCTSLNVIDLSSVKTIGNYAFFGCTGVSSIKFSSDLGSVGTSSFTKIKFYNGSLEITATAANLKGNTFIGTGSVLQLYSINYIVSFDSDGGPSVASQSISPGGKATYPPVSKTGFVLNGWYTSKIGGSKFDFSTTITSNITLYAHWTPLRYTVTFDANGGSPSTSQIISYGDNAAYPTTPTRSGYLFEGWYTTKTGSTAFSFETAITKDMTVYAHWKSSTTYYTLTFDANGGSPGSTQKVISGDTATYPAVPAKSGYRFDGWYTAKTGGTEFNFGTAITKNTTLYAHWIADTTYYTVKFDANGGSPGSTQKVISGDTATYPAVPAKSGYRFDGWYTAKTGGTEFNFGTAITKNTTLYAHWIADTTYYTVKFDANGGSPGSTQIVESGDTVDYPDTPSKNGCTFVGWYTSSTGGNEFDFDEAITKNITLFAHWKENKNVVKYYLTDNPGNISVYASTDEVQIIGNGAGTVTTSISISSRTNPLTIVLENASIKAKTYSSLIAGNGVNFTIIAKGTNNLTGYEGYPTITSNNLVINNDGSLRITGASSSYANDGSPGIKCTSLSINGSGSVYIKGGNGGNGGSGSDGYNGTDRSRLTDSALQRYSYTASSGGDAYSGSNGGKGGNGAYAVEANSITVKKVSATFVGGNGGNGGNGGKGGNGGLGAGGIPGVDPSCVGVNFVSDILGGKVIHSGDGGNGGKGGNGGNGGNGMPGTSCSIQGSATSITGDGGKGGNGGNGGNGGKGGTGNDRTIDSAWGAKYRNSDGGDGGRAGDGGNGGNGGNGATPGAGGSPGSSGTRGYYGYEAELSFKGWVNIGCEIYEGSSGNYGGIGYSGSYGATGKMI